MDKNSVNELETKDCQFLSQIFVFIGLSIKVIFNYSPLISLIINKQPIMIQINILIKHTISFLESKKIGKF